MKFDEIGTWSELKIRIVEEYAKAYSTILRAQKGFSYAYIDGFSGPGLHISRASGDVVPGSPLAVLGLTPPFDEYHFVEKNKEKAAELSRQIGARPGVTIYEGDCNQILPSTVFPRIRYEDFRRGLCLLDPYGLDLDWSVIVAAGKSRTIDLILNFPIMDANRNALWRNPVAVDERDHARMTASWGDDSWRGVAYSSRKGLFADFLEKEDNETVAEAFRKRLKAVAGFAFASKPLPMRNSKGATVYYLLGASQKEPAVKILDHVFRKHSGGRG